MRVVFMGTSEFAVPTLFELSESGFLPVSVYTRAPARGGARGLAIRKTPVHLASESLGIPVWTPTSLRDVETQRAFNNLAADITIVAAYGLMLPVPILEAPRLGCLNLHASLLPRWRGAAPIQRAVMAGDSQTGVDVMRMDIGLDTGPIAMREIIPIGSDETAGGLTSRLASIGAKLLISALRSIEVGVLEFHDQSRLDICYAQKIRKDEASIDWTQSAETVRNQIHGLSPAPGAFSRARIGSNEENIKCLRAEVTAGNGSPGMLLSAEEMRIACGMGSVRILQGQRPGGTIMSGGELMRSSKLSPGMVFTRSSRP